MPINQYTESELIYQTLGRKDTTAESTWSTTLSAIPCSTRVYHISHTSESKDARTQFQVRAIHNLHQYRKRNGHQSSLPDLSNQKKIARKKESQLHPASVNVNVKHQDQDQASGSNPPAGPGLSPICKTKNQDLKISTETFPSSSRNSPQYSPY